ECFAATIKIGVSCSVDSPAERMKIEIVVSELQRILGIADAKAVEIDVVALPSLPKQSHL
ncbi:hypothetical protein Tco_0351834, partial [Tanacetum coccineum]